MAARCCARLGHPMLRASARGLASVNKPLTTQAARIGLHRLRNTDQGWETQMSIILGTVFLLASGLVIRAMLKAPA
jgi:hypothetical protein